MHGDLPTGLDATDIETTKKIFGHSDFDVKRYTSKVYLSVEPSSISVVLDQLHARKTETSDHLSSHVNECYKQFIRYLFNQSPLFLFVSFFFYSQKHTHHKNNAPKTKYKQTKQNETKSMSMDALKIENQMTDCDEKLKNFSVYLKSLQETSFDFSRSYIK